MRGPRICRWFPASVSEVFSCVPSQVSPHKSLISCAICLVRFWGWTENAREYQKDLEELTQRAKEGKPLYGESPQAPWVQGNAYRNSVFSQLKLSTFPMYVSLQLRAIGKVTDNFIDTGSISLTTRTTEQTLPSMVSSLKRHRLPKSSSVYETSVYTSRMSDG